MQVVMPGPSRIYIGGMLCSCLGHAVLLGGILFSSASTTLRAPAQVETGPVLLIELIPLDRLGESDPAGHIPQVAEPPLAVLEQNNIVAVAPGRIEPDPVRAGPAVASAPAQAGPVSASALASRSSSEFTEYQRRLFESVARHSYYPPEAMPFDLAGVTTLAFRLDRLGYVVDSWIQESSGSQMLDTAAVEALHRAEPLPPVPPSLPVELDYVIQIDASLLRPPAGRPGN